MLITSMVCVFFKLILLTGILFEILTYLRLVKAFNLDKIAERRIRESPDLSLI